MDFSRIMLIVFALTFMSALFVGSGLLTKNVIKEEKDVVIYWIKLTVATCMFLAGIATLTTLSITMGW